MPSRRHSRQTGPEYLAIQFQPHHPSSLWPNSRSALLALGSRLQASGIARCRPVVRGPEPVLTPSPLRRTAAVVRNRRDVANRPHLDADGLQRANRRLAARARAGHTALDRAKTKRLGGVARVDRGLRRGKRRPLARALEANRAGARPRDEVPL